jgi:hypothetical protein
MSIQLKPRLGIESAVKGDSSEAIIFIQLIIYQSLKTLSVILNGGIIIE